MTAYICGGIAARLADYRIAPVPPSGEDPGSPGERWTMAGDRVFASRVRTIDAAELPAIRVYARRETVDPASYPKSGEDGTTARLLDVAVEAIVGAGVEAGDDVEARLDAFARQVEASLEWFEVPGLETATIRLVETGFDVSAEGTVPVGVARLSFQVDYRTPYRVRPPAPAGIPGIFLATDIGGTGDRFGAGKEENYERLTEAADLACGDNQ